MKTTELLRSAINKKPTQVEQEFNNAIKGRIKKSINDVRAEVGANIMNSVNSK